MKKWWIGILVVLLLLGGSLGLRLLLSEKPETPPAQPTQSGEEAEASPAPSPSPTAAPTPEETAPPQSTQGDGDGRQLVLTDDSVAVSEALCLGYTLEHWELFDSWEAAGIAAEDISVVRRLASSSQELLEREYIYAEEPLALNAGEKLLMVDIAVTKLSGDLLIGRIQPRLLRIFGEDEASSDVSYMLGSMCWFSESPGEEYLSDIFDCYDLPETGQSLSLRLGFVLTEQECQWLSEGKLALGFWEGMSFWGQWEAEEPPLALTPTQ